MAVVKDIQVGGEIEDGVDLVTLTRVCDATVSGTPANTVLERATAELDSNGLAFGAAHEAASLNFLLVRQRRGRQLGCEGGLALIRFEIEYRQHLFPDSYGGIASDIGEQTAALNFGTVQRQTTKDAAGIEMVVSPPPNTLWSAAPNQAPPLSVLKPYGVVVRERKNVTTPHAQMRAVVGKLNDIAEGPYAAKTLLCTAINSQSTSQGDDTQTRYEFANRPEGWQEEVVWRPPSGSPIAGHVDGVSRKTFDIYETTSFSVLNLDFTD